MKIFFSEEAITDLVDLDEFLLRSESAERADSILFGIEEACLNLSNFTDKGHVPPELDGYKLRYREIRFKVWRIIYRVDAKKLYILAIVDSRRDVQAFLQRRLLR